MKHSSTNEMIKLNIYDSKRWEQKCLRCLLLERAVKNK